MNQERFKAIIWDHYRASGRHDLPWRRLPRRGGKDRNERDPYRILVSEVMLQQTQVSRVLGAYPRFLRRFPTARSLARAANAEVLSVWQGLGYNRRALLLKRAAESVVRFHHGAFPRTAEELEALPGIGPSTRGALLAFAFDEPSAFIETNIRAVFLHHFFPGRRDVADREILPLIEETLDRENPRDWYYALMDYGVHLKQTVSNPSRQSRHHTRQSPFKGSNREVRSRIMRYVLERPRSLSEIVAYIGATPHDVAGNVDQMVSEGLLRRKAGKIGA